VKKPPWYTAEVAKVGMLVLDGETTRETAVAVLTRAVKAHPEHIDGLIAVDVARELSAWLKDHGAPAAQPSLFPDFPGLPREMRVAPAKTAEVADMTAEDLDHAKNMLLARTKNAIDGVTAAAERERKAFMDFYNKVRPLLTDGLTVADAMEKLAEKAA